MGGKNKKRLSGDFLKAFDIFSLSGFINWSGKRDLNNFPGMLQEVAQSCVALQYGDFSGDFLGAMLQEVAGSRAEWKPASSQLPAWLSYLFDYAAWKAERQALSQRKQVLQADTWLRDTLGFAGKDL